jgi:predicted transcriptional regulator
MTIQIPDDLARGLEGIATAQMKTVEQLAVDSLRHLLVSRSPAAI